MEANVVIFGTREGNSDTSIKITLVSTFSDGEVMSTPQQSYYKKGLDGGKSLKRPYHHLDPEFRHTLV